MRPTSYCPAWRRQTWGSRFGHAQRVVAAGFAFAVLAAATACSNDDTPTGPGNGPVTGAFSMRTARGFSVPHTFTDAVGKKLTVEGGSLTLGPNGTYALNYKGKLNTLEFDLTDEGTVSISGSSVTFTPDDGDTPFAGKIQGRTISVSFRIAGAMFELGFTGG